MLCVWNPPVTASFPFQNVSNAERVSMRMTSLWSTEKTWWRHQMETFSALLAICAGNSPVTGEFPTQRPVTRSFDVYFDLRPNERLSKQSRGWWFETLSSPLWRHRNGYRKSLLLKMVWYLSNKSRFWTLLNGFLNNYFSILSISTESNHQTEQNGWIKILSGLH